MKLFEEFKLYEKLWYHIDDAIAASNSNTIFALVQYWTPRQKGGSELINFDGLFVDKAEALARYALVSHHPSLGDRLSRIDLVQFTNLSKDEIDSIRAFDYEKVFNTANYTVLASTSNNGPGSASYKYYYVVCILEEAFSSPTVLSAGTIKIDVSKISAHETPEEVAMTDYFERAEIAYSDAWDDDMWDYLTRYVYEIDTTTYETEAGLPKTDTEILKYVEDSLADYKE